MSTITPTQSTPPPSPWPSPDLHRFTVDEYERMAHVLEDSCVELIDGYVVNNWIVNLVYRQVEVYTDPGTGTYHCRVDFRPGQDVPVVIDGAEVGRIAVAYILP